MKKIRVGITGESGFIGYHLSNFLKIKKGEFEVVPFEDSYFNCKKSLNAFIQQCDAVVHLAALNRHDEARIIYETNLRLVRQLVDSCEEARRFPHIIFSSSTQEFEENPYGKSKREGRLLFLDYAQKHKIPFTGLIIPNVFGPFCLPFYNSAIATFCFQLTNNLEPHIDVDKTIDLIYVIDLVETIASIVEKRVHQPEYYITPNAQKTVSEILSILISFKNSYLQSNLIPQIDDHFHISLFNTFRSYVNYSHFPVILNIKKDNRGKLVEILKSRTGGQIFYSTTKKGVTRGNHFHTRKIERFCVLHGKATVQLRKIGSQKIVFYHVSGEQPSIVDIPIYHTHNITNVGKDDLLTLFWTNEIFEPENSDTFSEDV